MIPKVHSINSIRKRIKIGAEAAVPRNEEMRESAVAIILRNPTPQTELLFIKRSERVGDPWSGHMAFPGGHREVYDTGLKETAIRETKEEIGLDLSNAEYFGSLKEQRAMARGRNINLVISPHVFYLKEEPVTSSNYEVDEIIWSNLGRLFAGECHDTETYTIGTKPITCNGYRLEQGHFVWGLTYRMLKAFFTILDSKWKSPKEL